MKLPPSEESSNKDVAILGLGAAITAAIAHAQLARTDASIIDRLLALKRDALTAAR